MKQPAIYIMSSQENGTLYTGVTSNLIKRVHEHKTLTNGFTGRHHCKMLVYYDLFEDMNAAISREKQIKGGSRIKKLRLINQFNPAWKDLYNKIV
ncbi:MAG: endonuclease [Alphaproteobacteria bacterium]|nr:MAG: endonuclease [Alphaproteobacteria bacterium]